MPRTAAPDDFEGHAALFWVSAAAGMPESLIDLAVASPLAARVPDTGEIWHPGYRSRHMWRLTLEWALEAAVAALGGIVKLIAGVRRFEYRIYGDVRDTLLLVPSELGSPTPQNTFVTSYIETGRQDAVLVFGPAGTCGSGARRLPFPVLKVARTSLALMSAGLRGSRGARGTFRDRLLMLEVWASWALGLRWLPSYFLAQALDATIAEGRISKLGSVHELNALVRTAWRVAARHDLRTCTVQHAEIARSKLWYFPYEEELRAGLILPQVMYVYSPEVIALLQPHLPGVEFRLGCGGRYARWRDVKPAPPSADGRCLFVGALGRFDNRVVIETMLRLAKLGGLGGAPRLRLHPAAEMPSGLARRLRRAVRAGTVALSEGVALEEDLARASVVIGMSSTVLEEALIIGRPAVQLTSSDYLEYVDLAGVPGALRIDWLDVTPEMLIEAARARVDASRLLARLGVYHPVVTYERLFQDAV